MSVLICGSLAYDTIMVFPDQFKNHILPDKVHILNVSFLVPRMRREFGGCAGNIAYNLHLLGGEPLPMATVGQDFSAYRSHFEALGIPLTHVKELPESYTPQAFITTDHDNNQITAFHPGAMNFSHYNSVTDAKDATLAIVAMISGSPPSSFRLYAMLPAQPPNTRLMSGTRKQTFRMWIWSGRMQSLKRSLKTIMLS